MNRGASVTARALPILTVAGAWADAGSARASVPATDAAPAERRNADRCMPAAFETQAGVLSRKCRVVRRFDAPRGGRVHASGVKWAFEIYVYESDRSHGVRWPGRAR